MSQYDQLPVTTVGLRFFFNFFFSLPAAKKIFVYIFERSCMFAVWQSAAILLELSALEMLICWSYLLLKSHSLWGFAEGSRHFVICCFFQEYISKDVTF